jgi:hypothetical protein
MLLGGLAGVEVVGNDGTVADPDDAPEIRRTTELNDVLDGPGAPIERLKLMVSQDVHGRTTLAAADTVGDGDLPHEQFREKIISSAEHANRVTDTQTLRNTCPEVDAEKVIELLPDRERQNVMPRRKLGKLDLRRGKRPDRTRRGWRCRGCSQRRFGRDGRRRGGRLGGGCLCCGHAALVMLRGKQSRRYNRLSMSAPPTSATVADHANSRLWIIRPRSREG